MSKYMDALEDVSDVSSSDSEADKEATEDRGPSKKCKAAAPDLEELQKVGFTSGPSVLAVPEPQGLNSWEWGSGSQRAELGEEEEDFEAREQTRQAATSGAEEAVLRALQQKAEALQRRDEERAEHQKRQQDRRKTYQQREKRKRDMGMQNSDKNYVEDEKRNARNMGVYNPF